MRALCLCSTVSTLRPALAFIGSRHSLSITDPEVQFIGRLTEELLLATSLGTRLGVSVVINGVVIESVSETDISNKNKNYIRNGDRK